MYEIYWIEMLQVKEIAVGEVLSWYVTLTFCFHWASPPVPSKVSSSVQGATFPRICPRVKVPGWSVWKAGAGVQVVSLERRRGKGIHSQTECLKQNVCSSWTCDNPPPWNLRLRRVIRRFLGVLAPYRHPQASPWESPTLVLRLRLWLRVDWPSFPYPSTRSA